MDSHTIYKTAAGIIGIIPTFNYLIDLCEKFPDRFDIELNEIYYKKYDKWKLQFGMFDNESIDVLLYSYSFKGNLNDAILQGFKVENFRETERYDDYICLITYKFHSI